MTRLRASSGQDEFQGKSRASSSRAAQRAAVAPNPKPATGSKRKAKWLEEDEGEEDTEEGMPEFLSKGNGFMEKSYDEVSQLRQSMEKQAKVEHLKLLYELEVGDKKKSVKGQLLKLLWEGNLEKEAAPAQ